VIPHSPRPTAPRPVSCAAGQKGSGEGKSNALRRLYQHGLEAGLAEAIKDGTLRKYVVAHAESLGLSPEEAKGVLIELETIVL